VILTTTCGLEPNRTIEYIPIVNDELKIANAPNIPTIVYKRNNFVQTYHEENFLDWDECVSKNSPHDCVEVDSNHPLYILYTSGTTGMETQIFNIQCSISF
jgi:acyl-coenzyme A synthetase/AMP-(fatty) acid ligase